MYVLIKDENLPHFIALDSKMKNINFYVSAQHGLRISIWRDAISEERSDPMTVDKAVEVYKLLCEKLNCTMIPAEEFN
jgi:hypothetical protein